MDTRVFARNDALLEHQDTQRRPKPRPRYGTGERRATRTPGFDPGSMASTVEAPPFDSREQPDTPYPSLRCLSPQTAAGPRI
jgi:hypothetical protein